jgi:hypothetical protein
MAHFLLSQLDKRPTDRPTGQRPAHLHTSPAGCCYILIRLSIRGISDGDSPSSLPIHTRQPQQPASQSISQPFQSGRRTSEHRRPSGCTVLWLVSRINQHLRCFRHGRGWGCGVCVPYQNSIVLNSRLLSTGLLLGVSGVGFGMFWACGRGAHIRLNCPERSGCVVHTRMCACMWAVYSQYVHLLQFSFIDV